MLTVITHQEGRRIFVTTLDRRHVRELQGSPLNRKRCVTNLLHLIEGTVKTQEDFWPLGFNGAGWREHILIIQRGKNILGRYAQRGQPIMGEGDKDAFALLTNDVDLFHTRHMQQALAQRFRITYQQSLRLAFGFQGKQSKGHI
ncbi:hypothetical protein D3C76_844710 [compost metagenome]